jgi:hypothetical protein
VLDGIEGPVKNQAILHVVPLLEQTIHQSGPCELFTDLGRTEGL